MHSVPEEARDVELVPLYEERYVLLAPATCCRRALRPCGGRMRHSCRWRRRPPTCGTGRSSTRPSPTTRPHRHPTGRDRLRRFDVGASRHRRLGVHHAAHLVVDHLMAGDIRVVELVDPTLTAQIAVATNSAGPGSPVARAFRCARKSCRRTNSSTPGCSESPVAADDHPLATALFGLRLVRCPLSTPAAGSRSQSTIAGPFDTSASANADCSSPGVVT